MVTRLSFLPSFLFPPFPPFLLSSAPRHSGSGNGAAPTERTGIRTETRTGIRAWTGTGTRHRDPRRAGPRGPAGAARPFPCSPCSVQSRFPCREEPRPDLPRGHSPGALSPRGAKVHGEGTGDFGETLSRSRGADPSGNAAVEPLPSGLSGERGGNGVPRECDGVRMVSPGSGMGGSDVPRLGAVAEARRGARGRVGAAPA